MTKKTSSASSGTRKKHARKAAGPEGDPLPIEKKAKGKDRGKKASKEPPQKVYVAPVKPQPVQPDPLDTMGLSHRLPPDLLVVLRSLTKKATVTKIRALEELQSGWVDKCLKEGEESDLVYPLLDMLPVWLHHVSALLLHPSRRVRLVTAATHASFLRIPYIRDGIFTSLRDSTGTQSSSILGAWAMAAHDIDRQVATHALKSWIAAISLHAADAHSHLILDAEHLFPQLISFTQRALSQPLELYAHLNPVTPAVATTTPSAPSGSKRSQGGARPPPPSAVSAAKREEAEQNASRTKADELEESDQDRKARLRVGAFGATRWILDSRSPIPLDALSSSFASPALWSSLYHGETASFVPDTVESFGFGQTIVRKAAWGLVQSLLKNSQRETLSLPILSTAILRSAWVEPDTTVLAVLWQPLLTFLKQFPNAWELEAAYNLSHEAQRHDDSDGESDEEDAIVEEEEDEVVNAPRSSTSSRGPSEAYANFLQFLELGCSGAPLQGYPTVVIILSTMSSSVIASTSTPLDTLFTSFWAAIDGRALSSLQRNAASTAFLESLLECVTFLVKRLRAGGSHSVLISSSSSEDGVRASEELVREQITRVWKELAGKGLRVAESSAARIIGKTLSAWEAIDSGLFNAAWDALVRSLDDHKSDSPSLIPTLLTGLDRHFDTASSSSGQLATKTLITDVSRKALAQCEGVLSDMTTEEDKGINGLVDLMNAFESRLFEDTELSNRIDDLIRQNAYRLIKVSPSLLLAYLSHRNDETSCLGLWHALLGELGKNADSTTTREFLDPLFLAVEKRQVPEYLRPRGDELDAYFLQLFANRGTLEYVHRVLRTPRYFISQKGLEDLVQLVTSSFEQEVDNALSESSSAMGDSITVLRTIFEHRAEMIKTSAVAMDLVPRIYIAGYLLPETDPTTVGDDVARDLWERWVKMVAPELQAQTVVAIKCRMKELILDTRTRATPNVILRVLSQDSLGANVNWMTDILPTKQEVDAMLEDLSSDPLDSSIAVLDPLVPPTSQFSNSLPRHFNTHTLDSRGHSSYARVVTAIMQILLEDRQAGREHLWALKHVFALSLYASDFISTPSAESPVFGVSAIEHGLDEVVSRAQQVSTYLLISSSVDEGWTSKVVQRLSASTEKADGEGLHGLTRFLVELIGSARAADTIRESRIVYEVLRHVFDEIDVAEADSWVLLARKMEKIAPHTSIAIVAAIAAFAPEPPRLDRYRNELAADLLGIKPQEANTKGLALLRTLALSAPALDSDVVFLPQLRAINVTKACQSWISANDEISEEIQDEMTQVFLHLAPILQNEPGSHWELIFDILEDNLERCSFDDDATLITMWRTLKLITIVQDLALTNKAFREDWRVREVPVLRAVRGLAAVRLDKLAVSAPRSACRELVLSIVQSLPSTLIDEDTLPNMCHLLADPSSEVHKMAYQLLQAAARKRTESLVIEAGLDVDAVIVPKLPSELMFLLERNVNQFSGSELDEQRMFGYLLGWMLVFDSFQNASLKVRSGYIDHLREMDIIATHLIPTIMRLLSLENGVSKAFKLDIWAVDEYYVQLYDPGTFSSIPVLAAHLYYRALITCPSLVRTWVLDCTDRQLSSGIVAYTAQHFSAVIIRAELAHVKSEATTQELVDDQLSVKVSSATNEVTASYLVDEHLLEIKLKIPADWPLHKIEIKDVQRVGVDENRWRSWLLAVQLTIWAHNGRIVDALSLFKKNVTLHFEGQVECAICYSIISVTDGTLPRKPCKTCKNRFHAGCLFKWFNTSHSSSCPLCRSDIF